LTPITRKVLVIGGAGYIGSHMLKHLDQLGHWSVALDNLSHGHRDAVRNGRLVVGDMGDRGLLERVLTENRYDAVMHFASLIQVGESVRNPSAYYHNNFVLTKQLLDTLLQHGVRKFVFSSTAAVYGVPRTALLAESHPCDAINPYGRSKWMVEQLLRDYDHAYGLKSVSLRYFNAAGADPDGQLGERHDPESHLIPLALRAASGTGPTLTVHGTDYPTADGSCIRDFVHVSDLASAHALALDYLLAGGDTCSLNLGTGQGYSVLQVLAAVEQVTGRRVPHHLGPRRPGDPPVLVADPSMARTVLSWSVRRSDLPTLLADAWRWEQSNTNRAKRDQAEHST
jgi:UDP-glucose 4-epimerase